MIKGIQASRERALDAMTEQAVGAFWKGCRDEPTAAMVIRNALRAAEPVLYERYIGDRKRYKNGFAAATGVTLELLGLAGSAATREERAFNAGSAISAMMAGRMQDAEERRMREIVHDNEIYYRLAEALSGMSRSREFREALSALGSREYIKAGRANGTIFGAESFDDAFCAVASTIAPDVRALVMLSLEENKSYGLKGLMKHLSAVTGHDEIVTKEALRAVVGKGGPLESVGAIRVERPMLRDSGQRFVRPVTVYSRGANYERIRPLAEAAIEYVAGRLHAGQKFCTLQSVMSAPGKKGSSLPIDMYRILKLVALQNGTLSRAEICARLEPGNPHDGHVRNTIDRLRAIQVLEVSHVSQEGPNELRSVDGRHHVRTTVRVNEDTWELLKLMDQIGKTASDLLGLGNSSLLRAGHKSAGTDSVPLDKIRDVCRAYLKENHRDAFARSRLMESSILKLAEKPMQRAELEARVITDTNLFGRSGLRSKKAVHRKVETLLRSVSIEQDSMGNIRLRTA